MAAWRDRGLGWRAVLVAFVLLAVMWAAEAREIVKPGMGHYIAAFDTLAVERARRDLLEAEKILAALNVLTAEINRLARAEQIARERRLRQHAERVQAWHGLPRQAMQPGTGWHEVR